MERLRLAQTLDKVSCPPSRFGWTLFTVQKAERVGRLVRLTGEQHLHGIWKAAVWRLDIALCSHKGIWISIREKCWFSLIHCLEISAVHVSVSAWWGWSKIACFYCCCKCFSVCKHALPSNWREFVAGDELGTHKLWQFQVVCFFFHGPFLPN